MDSLSRIDADVGIAIYLFGLYVDCHRKPGQERVILVVNGYLDRYALGNFGEVASGVAGRNHRELCGRVGTELDDFALVFLARTGID